LKVESQGSLGTALVRVAGGFPRSGRAAGGATTIGTARSRQSGAGGGRDHPWARGHATTRLAEGGAHLRKARDHGGVVSERGSLTIRNRSNLQSQYPPIPSNKAPNGPMTNQIGIPKVVPDPEPNKAGPTNTIIPTKVTKRPPRRYSHDSIKRGTRAPISACSGRISYLITP